MGKNKEVSCNVCFKPMRSDVMKRHMKIHIIHTLENNVKMCRQLLNEMLNEVLEPQESTTKRKHEDNESQAQPNIKRKCVENIIDVDELTKMFESITL